MENIVSAPETSEIPLAWNQMKNVPASLKCQIKFIKK